MGFHTGPNVVGGQSCSCTTTALIIGVISVVTTILLMLIISVVVHITVYQCVYKPKVKSFRAVTVRDHDRTEKEDVTRGGDAIVYDVVDKRVGIALEMKENEAYSVGGRVGGLELKQNEAYGIATSQ